MNRLLAVCALLVTTTAYAESLEEKKFWKRQRDYVDETLKRTNKACDTNLTFDWENQTQLRTEVEKTKHTPNGVCTSIISEVASLCRQGDDEKAAVKAKITSLSCGYAKERSLDLKGGKLRYLGNNTQANFSEWARPWLLKHL